MKICTADSNTTSMHSKIKCENIFPAKVGNIKHAIFGYEWTKFNFQRLKVL